MLKSSSIIWLILIGSDIAFKSDFIFLPLIEVCAILVWIERNEVRTSLSHLPYFSFSPKEWGELKRKRDSCCLPFQ